MSEEERGKFIAKFFAVGLSATVGIGFIVEGLTSLNDGFANSILGLLFAGFGVVLLITAWRIMGRNL